MHRKTRTGSARKGPDGGGDGRVARTGVTISVLVLLAALLLSVGLAGGFLLTRSRIPRSLESSTPAGSMTVASAPFDDSRTIQLTVTLGSSATVISPTNGTVTASDCARNAIIASGGTPIAVDATPLPALHTATPLYRRLPSGTQGQDARALNDALSSLGYAAPDSDWFTWDSIAAWNAFADATGARHITKDGDWGIDPSYFIWLPAGSVTVADCAIAVGRQAAQGADLFTTAAMPVKATFPTAAQDMIAGDRTLRVNGQDFSIAADTAESTDPALMAAIVASGEYRMALLNGAGTGAGGNGAGGAAGGMGTGEGDTVQVGLTWRLSSPIASITVPPTALYDAAGGRACVAVEGTPTPVRIIASQLGKTMVVPDGGGPFSTVDVAPTTTAPCRGE